MEKYTEDKNAAKKKKTTRKHVKKTQYAEEKRNTVHRADNENKNEGKKGKKTYEYYAIIMMTS